MEMVCWARVIVSVSFVYSGCCLGVSKEYGLFKMVVVTECGF